MGSRLRGLGQSIFKHRHLVLGIWLLLLILGGMGARNLPLALMDGSGESSGSQSQAIDRALRKEFDNPFVRSLLVVVSSEKNRVDQPVFQSWLRDAAGIVNKLPQVDGVSSILEGGDSRLASPDGHTTLLMVGLNAKSARDEEKSVPIVRTALADLKASIKKFDPQAGFAVTGYPAITYDINRYNKHDGEVAEMRALPLTAV
ncbi:MAG TPA: MMPL family transporter, partial [Chroococcales cyanobacterium]